MTLPQEMRWSVDIPTRTAAGERGVHIFVVGAATRGEAVDAAWQRANSSDATRHRSGAVLAAARHHLTALPFPQSLL